MSAQQIYDNFHKGPPGPSKLTAAQESAQALAQSFPERAVTIQRLAEKMESFWTGDAASAAAAGAAPLALLHEATGEDCGVTQSLISGQVEAFGSAVHSTQPVPPKPSVGDFLFSAAQTSATFGIAAFTGHTSAQEQAHARDAVMHQNVQAMDVYHAASVNNSNVPTDNALLPNIADVQTAPQSGPGGSHAGNPPSVGGDGGAIHTGGGTQHTQHTGGGSSPAHTSASAAGGTPPVGGGGNPALTGASNVSGGGTGVPGIPVGGGYDGGDYQVGGSRYGRNSNDPTTGAIGGVPIGGVGGGGMGGGDTIRSGGAVGGSAEGSATGARGGLSGPGATAAEQAAMRSGAAGRPTGPMGGMGGAGRGGRGEDDREHSAPGYLQENDPESIFGTDEKTAPPVIGE